MRINSVAEVTFYCAMAMIAVTMMAGRAHAQCSSNTITPKTCQFGTNRLNVFPGTTGYNICVDVNENPFSVKSTLGDGGLSAQDCKTAVQQDGKNCIEFYAELQCSSACELCGMNICPYFCDNYEQLCPIANQLGCFTFMNCAAEGTKPGTTCSRWDVSGSLPGTIATTSTSTTRTTTTRTGTGTSTTTTDSSDASSISVGAAMIIFALLFFFA